MSEMQLLWEDGLSWDIGESSLPVRLPSLQCLTYACRPYSRSTERRALMSGEAT